MSIDPNKAFGMKATNKSYTLEFRKEDYNTTSVKVTDMETQKMSFGQRLSAAWALLTGKTTIGELAFPIRLRNSDFYHLSFIYRPEKEKADKPVTMKAPKAEKTIEADKVTAEKPVKKSRTPRKPKAAAPKTQE